MCIVLTALCSNPLQQLTLTEYTHSDQRHWSRPAGVSVFVANAQRSEHLWTTCQTAIICGTEQQKMLQTRTMSATTKKKLLKQKSATSAVDFIAHELLAPINTHGIQCLKDWKQRRRAIVSATADENSFLISRILTLYGWLGHTTERNFANYSCC